MNCTSFVTIVGMLFGSPLWAAVESNVPAATEQQVVQYLTGRVHEIKQDFLVWNWFSADDRDPVWATRLSADHPAGYDHLKSTSRRYWQNLCSTEVLLNPPDCDTKKQESHGAGNAYGQGLYTSIDPIATKGYGGGNWVAMQVKIPNGFRVLDADLDFHQFPENVAAFFHQSGTCDNIFSIDMLINSNLNEGRPHCKLMVRRILKDALKLDGFLYTYPTSSLNNCKGLYANRALIVANIDAIQPGDVKVFNAQTVDATADRTYIHSLSLETQHGILWNDLGEKDLDPKLDAWKKRNLFACKPAGPYVGGH
jgi:hypothetical protein